MCGCLMSIRQFVDSRGNKKETCYNKIGDFLKIQEISRSMNTHDLTKVIFTLDKQIIAS